MRVSMDGLRKHLIVNYNSLVRKLNNSMTKDGVVSITPENIERELDSIRNGLVTLAFSYIEGSEGFKSMDDNTIFESFNSNDPI